MNHDQLCPAPLCDWTGRPGAECMGYEDCWHDCQCNLIARAREDERMRDDDYAYVATQSEAIGYLAALRDAAKAVEALHVEWNADGPDHVCDGTVMHETLKLAVAAIEALGGER